MTTFRVSRNMPGAGNLLLGRRRALARLAVRYLYRCAPVVAEGWPAPPLVGSLMVRTWQTGLPSIAELGTTNPPCPPYSDGSHDALEAFELDHVRLGVDQVGLAVVVQAADVGARAGWRRENAVRVHVADDRHPVDGSDGSLAFVTYCCGLVSSAVLGTADPSLGTGRTGRPARLCA